MNYWQTEILDSVESWAGHSHCLFREVGWLVQGRIDGVLMPLVLDAHEMISDTSEQFWKRVRLVGVEVKATRPDFLAGLRKQQYQRYDKHLAGIYVATKKGICKTKEIPPGVGHLIYHWHGRQSRIVCRRRPKLSLVEYEATVAFRLMFMVVARMRRDYWKRCQHDREALACVGQEAGRRISAALLAALEAEQASRAQRSE